MTLKVDPVALRMFAASVTGVADAIVGWDTGEPFTQSQSALPGTDFGHVCARGSEATARALDNICTRLLEVADITNGTANDYDTTEADFVAALSAMGPTR